MTKKRAVFSPIPFHRSVIEQMNGITPRSKNAVAHAVCLAALVRRTSCPPAHCGEVKSALSEMTKRLGGLASKGKKRVFTRVQISEIYGAHDTLGEQAKMHPHAVSTTQPSSAVVAESAPAGESGDEPRAAAA